MEAIIRKIIQILLLPFKAFEFVFIKLPWMGIKWFFKLPFKILKWIILPIVFLFVVVALPIMIFLAPGWYYDWIE